MTQTILHLLITYGVMTCSAPTANATLGWLIIDHPQSPAVITTRIRCTGEA